MENRTTLILNKLKEYYKLDSDFKFAKFLGIAPTTLSSWKTRDRFDYDLVYARCEGIDGNWLLTAEGPVERNARNGHYNPEIKRAPVEKLQGNGIPLIPCDAMAGVFSGDVSVTEIECDRYIVPIFNSADFLITIKGTSMVPRYYGGDIVACKILPLDNIFFQWNKIYVLDTIQGPLLKRITRNPGKEESVILVSENPEFEPFELPIIEIRAVSIVLGAIHME